MTKRKGRIQRKIKLYIVLVMLVTMLGTSMSFDTLYSIASTTTTGVVNTTSSDLNVRSGPGTEFEKIGTLAKGITVVILGEEGDWYQIQFDAGVGYVSKRYITDVVTVEIDEEYIASMVELGFPESYAVKLERLHSQYPLWVFEPVMTGLDWGDVIANEAVVGKNLIQNHQDDSRKSTESGAYNWYKNEWAIYDASTWVSVSESFLSYCMDPRNWLDEKHIFQFEALTYAEYQNLEGIKEILSTGFMAGSYVDVDGEEKDYAQTFLDAGIALNVSPYHLASRCKQEQGNGGTSPLISGTYPGFEGYYNYFNIGAYGSSADGTLYRRGLTYAKNQGWDSIYKAIYGGSEKVANNYIARGQNTLYFQKYNVVEKDTLYGHQYMSNVQAAISESKIISAGYTNKDQAFVFQIPVYMNMPESACAHVDNGNPNNWLATLEAAGQSLTPAFDGAETQYSVLVPEDVATIEIVATAVVSEAQIVGTGTHELVYGDNPIIVSCTAENGDVREYILNVTREIPAGNTVDFNETSGFTTEYKVDTYISGLEVGMDANTFLAGIVTEGCAASVVKADGSEHTGAMSTGDLLLFHNEAGEKLGEYQILIYGDLNGDGKISNPDLVRLKRHILGITVLEGAQLEAADTNHRADGANNADLVLIKRHILGTKTIMQ